MSMYIEKRRYVLGLLELLELNGATLANRPKGASYQFHPSPSPALYISVPSSANSLALSTVHFTQQHSTLSGSILSCNIIRSPFRRLFSHQSRKMPLYNVRAPVLSLASSPPFAYGLSGTCYSRLPSRRMLPSKSFRSELLFYPSLIFISFRVSYLLTL